MAITPPNTPPSTNKTPFEDFNALQPKQKRAKYAESQENSEEIYRSQQAASTALSDVSRNWENSPTRDIFSPEPSFSTPPDTSRSYTKHLFEKANGISSDQKRFERTQQAAISETSPTPKDLKTSPKSYPSFSMPYDISPPRTTQINPPEIRKVSQNKLPLETRDPYIQRTFAIKRHLLDLQHGDFPFTIQIGNEEITILKNIGFLGSGEYQDCYLVQGKGLDFPLKIKDKKLLKKDDFPCTIQIGNEEITILKRIFSSDSEGDRDLYLVRGKSLDLALKVPNENLLKRIDRYIMKGFVEKDIKYYPPIAEAFQNQPCFRIARQYDLEILFNENQIKMVHGCRLAEYIPSPIPNGPLPEILKKRLKEFLFFCWKNNNLHLDVKKDNLHIEPQYVNGNIADYHIVLIDPVHPQDKFRDVINQTLRSFAPEGSELYKYLDPR